MKINIVMELQTVCNIHIWGPQNMYWKINKEHYVQKRINIFVDTWDINK